VTGVTVLANAGVAETGARAGDVGIAVAAAIGTRPRGAVSIGGGISVDVGTGAVVVVAEVAVVAVAAVVDGEVVDAEVVDVGTVGGECAFDDEHAAPRHAIARSATHRPGPRRTPS
jgi:hypothetical protein